VNFQNSGLETCNELKRADDSPASPKGEETIVSRPRITVHWGTSVVDLGPLNEEDLARWQDREADLYNECHVQICATCIFLLFAAGFTVATWFHIHEYVCLPVAILLTTHTVEGLFRCRKARREYELAICDYVHRC
jgi:hypothetical protein